MPQLLSLCSGVWGPQLLPILARVHAPHPESSPLLPAIREGPSTAKDVISQSINFLKMQIPGRSPGPVQTECEGVGPEHLTAQPPRWFSWARGWRSLCLWASGGSLESQLSLLSGSLRRERKKQVTGLSSAQELEKSQCSGNGSVHPRSAGSRRASCGCGLPASSLGSLSAWAVLILLLTGCSPRLPQW